MTCGRSSFTEMLTSHDFCAIVIKRNADVDLSKGVGCQPVNWVRIKVTCISNFATLFQLNKKIIFCLESLK